MSEDAKIVDQALADLGVGHVLPRRRATAIASEYLGRPVYPWRRAVWRHDLAAYLARG